MKQRIVLDTNCLISSLSRKSKSYEVWKGLHEGRKTAINNKKKKKMLIVCELFINFAAVKAL